jgi:acyl-CoA synthetase (AMP-forming)/AMP-acid ligase II
MAPKNLGSAVADRADPAATALIDLGGAPRSFSYADIQRLSDAFARGLLRRGVRRGERVAILSANSAEYIVAFLGTMRAGLVSVPVNYRLATTTVNFILEDADVRLVLCDAARQPLLPPHVPSIDIADTFAPADEGSFDAVQPGAGEPALFLYTSGSTGQPKGVVLSHQSHLWVLERRADPPPQPGQRVLVAAPLYHMNALSVCQSTLHTGGTIVLLPSFTASSYIEAASRHRVHALTAVPTMIAMMLRAHVAMASVDLSSVQSLRVGSAPLSEQLIEQMRKAFPRARIVHGYGTTEAGPIVFGPHPDGLQRTPLTVGVAHTSVDLRLRRDGAVVTDEGVLEMRCPALMNGYYKLPEATRNVLTSDGFYVTGDVFRRDADGFHYFVGRTDDMFVCGGENIWPGEVEMMLERHPAVHQACVVPAPDELKAHKPVAFVVPRAGATVSEDALRGFALANGPAYQHPRRVWFLDELPLAGTNKIDRRRLATRAAMQMQQEPR